MIVSSFASSGYNIQLLYLFRKASIAFFLNLNYIGSHLLSDQKSIVASRQLAALYWAYKMLQYSQCCTSCKKFRPSVFRTGYFQTSP